MLVQYWMSRGLVTIDPEESMSQAIRLMKDHHIGRLPVVDKKGRLVGILSDRDIKRASASDATTLAVHELAYLLTRVRVKDIMTAHPVTISPLDTVEEAALVMLERHVSGLPVVDEAGKAIAVLTQGDIFRALISLSGVTAGGVQFAMDLPDRPGSIKDACDVIRAHGGRIVSIFTTQDRAAEERRRVYVRARSLDRARLMALKEELKGVGELLYILDSRQRTKELISPGPAAGAARAAVAG